MTLKSLPNLITGARIGLAFAVFVLLAVARQSYADVGMRLTLAALVVFVVAALTDFVDGWLARKLNAASAIGAMLDPIADKIALVAAGFGLAGLDPGLTLWPSALMLSRELLVSGLRETGMKLPVTKLAKWKTPPSSSPMPSPCSPSSCPRPGWAPWACYGSRRGSPSGPGLITF